MQGSLFDDESTGFTHQTHDLGNALIEEYRSIYNQEKAALLLAELIQLTPWHQDHLVIAGKTVQVPRLQCWMGDVGSNYSYSGIRLKPVPWSPVVLEIRAKIKEVCGYEFNSVLLNHYRDGADSVAWHADDEPELGANPVIASLSLGADRSLQLCPKNTTSRAVKARIPLLNGSLLIMGKGMQNNWLHQVPKEKKNTKVRINLTFRNIQRQS
ncbi:MAG: alpha-ketoglutarate-dependent dioxygenase AlkB [Pseudohongiellaceae bacterium]